MKKMSALMESCYTKTVMSGVMGFGLGGMFGAFMASVRLFPSRPSLSLSRALLLPPSFSTISLTNTPLPQS